MQPGRNPIPDIFNGSKRLEVPFFQRAYVWDEEEWVRLLEDAKEVCVTSTPYFLGSVILKQERTPTSARIGDVRTIIDGQQRLTTISILLKVLSLKADNGGDFNWRFLPKGEPALRHSKRDVTAYTEIMALSEPAHVADEGKIRKCYNYFLDNADPEMLDYDVVCNGFGC